ncbi:methionyl-tRNA formyltransferase [Myxococcota bacterium]|nr:methionyl-tRNA formyltransferase [Myxococcota bacterium]MBU1431956.1 methionyl-tRNA formyltransferase [Myxococcota bacterium]MBU1898286.1 methionyl-tRNA formyltransferase [Myxococcota bacterium]
MSVLYFGDPEGALALLDAGVSLCGVVHGRPGGRGRLALLRRVGDLPRFVGLDLKSPAAVSRLAALQPTRLVSGFYPHLIPAPILALAPGVNVHPSLLPRWRGPDPCGWTLRAGDAEAGMTVHVLTEALDEGPILATRRVPILPHESCGHLAERLEPLSALFLAEIVARLEAGEVITPRPQGEGATWAAQLSPDALEIDWAKPAEAVYGWIRAAAPDPGAFTGLEGELLVVYSGRVVESGAFAALPPGAPFIQGGALTIRCGDAASLRIGRARLGRKATSGRALARLLTHATGA